VADFRWKLNHVKFWRHRVYNTFGGGGGSCNPVALRPLSLHVLRTTKHRSRTWSKTNSHLRQNSLEYTDQSPRYRQCTYAFTWWFCCLSDFHQNRNLSTTLRVITNINYTYENPSGGNHAVSWGQTDGRRDLKENLPQFKTTDVSCVQRTSSIFR
jgi:hypothetical protein